MLTYNLHVLLVSRIDHKHYHIVILFLIGQHLNFTSKNGQIKKNTRMYPYSYEAIEIKIYKNNELRFTSNKYEYILLRSL